MYIYTDMHMYMHAYTHIQTYMYNVKKINNVWWTPISAANWQVQRGRERDWGAGSARKVFIQKSEPLERRGIGHPPQ